MVLGKGHTAIVPDKCSGDSIGRVALLSCAASHHDLELSALERLSTDWAGVGPELVAAAGPIRGAVVLATCNRFELYLDVDDERVPEACAAAAGAVAARSGLTPVAFSSPSRATRALPIPKRCTTSAITSTAKPLAMPDRSSVTGACLRARLPEWSNSRTS